MALKIKNIPFVGGDIATFEFDFGTKVAGSVAECPMKLYWSYTDALKTPSNITGDASTGFSEQTYQTAINLIKFQDMQTAKYNSFDLSSTSEMPDIIAQVMIELDLTPLCNSLFGGSHSAMVSALKAINPTVYAKGSGDGMGAGISWWNDAGTSPIGWNGSNTGWSGFTYMGNAIAFISPIVGLDRTPINADNKFRLLIYNLYPSEDGTVASEVDLDYINIKLQFARVPDVIAPIPITLPDIWSLIIKGFSPVWDGSLTSDKVILALSPNYNDFNNFIMIQKYTSTANTYRVVMLVAGTKVADLLITQTITKFKTVNFLLTKNNNILTFYLLINGSVINKQSTTISSTLSGVLNMYIGQRQDNGAQADGFINSIVFLPNKVISDDTEAESILRGTAEGSEEDELFDISKVILHDASIQNSAIVLNAKSQYDGSYINIPVLPNNQYELKVTMDCNNSSGNPYTEITACYGNKITLETIKDLMGSQSKIYDYVFTTPDKCNYIRLFFANATNDTYTYTWSNISLKLKM